MHRRLTPVGCGTKFFFGGARLFATAPAALVQRLAAPDCFTRPLQAGVLRLVFRHSRAYSSSKVIHHLDGRSQKRPACQVVNNFGGGENFYCQQPSILPNPRIGHAGTGRRIPRSNATNVYPETFAPAPCARSQRNTQNPSPASANWQRRTSISASIRSEPRARTN